MREVVLDTETTGLDPAQGHRIVEIGALELVNHVPSGQSFHAYINPERPVPPEAEAVHGLGNAFLTEKPVFAAVAEEFLAFIADTALVIHNASFDVGFLNAELGYLEKPPILSDRVIDTLMLARQKHPMGPNSLDALCKRYGIDNSKRTRHGALLDSELLADVYLELIGGRQTALTLATTAAARPILSTQAQPGLARARALPARLSEEERVAHGRFVDGLGSGALWKKVAD